MRIAGSREESTLDLIYRSIWFVVIKFIDLQRLVIEGKIDKKYNKEKNKQNRKTMGHPVWWDTDRMKRHELLIGNNVYYTVYIFINFIYFISVINFILIIVLCFFAERRMPWSVCA